MIITKFPDLSGSQAETIDLPAGGLAQWLLSLPEYPSKAACPLVSFNVYGDQRTDKGSLRHNPNITAATGVQLDYDAGAMTPAQAAELLQRAGVEAVVVTTPSHGVKGHRWRVFAPLSAPASIEARHILAQRLNGVLGGVVASESFTASQAYYVGRVAGVRYEVHESHGLPVDTPGMLDGVTPIGPAPTGGRTAPGDEFALIPKRADSIDQIRAALSLIPNDAPDWHAWSRVGMAVFVASAGDLDGLDAWREWSDRCPVAGNGHDTVDARWDHWLHSSPPDSIGIGSLVREAGGADAVKRAMLTRRAPPPPPPPTAADATPPAQGFQMATEAQALLSGRGRRLVRFNGTWFTREPGGYYRELEEEVLRSEIRHACGWPVKIAEVNTAIDELKSRTIVGNYEVDLPHWIERPDARPDARGLIVCRNGIMDPDTRTLYQHTDSLLTLNALPFDYDPRAPSPGRWLRFLGEVFKGDQESIRELQKIIGYYLTQDTSQQKIVALVGPRRSGKGTIVRVTQALLGLNNVCAPSFSIFGGPFGLASLIGKQLAVFPDARVGARTDKTLVAERLLSLSGEDVLDIPRKHKDDWTGKINARIMIVSNELPVFGDASGALAGRYVVLHTPDSFYGREDMTLTDALLQELPGVLNWALTGLDRLRAGDRLRTPEAAAELLAEMDYLGSPVKAFVSERCILGPTSDADMILKQDLWNEYRAWHVASGIQGHPLSEAIFARSVNTCYPGKIHTYRPRTGDEVRPRMWYGIRWRTDADG